MKIPIPILSAITLAAITTTACSVPPTIHDSGPSPTFNAQVQSDCDDGTLIPGYPSPTPCPPTSAVDQLMHGRALASREKLRHAGELGVPPESDLELVEAAAKDRVPFTFSVGDCSWLRTTDGALWSLNGTGGALTRDVEHERLFQQTPGARVTIGCTMRGVADSIPVGLDSVAADAANAAGVPYRWTDSCRQFVRMNRQRYELPDAPTAQGTAPRTEVLAWGCHSGVERPGGVR